MQKENRETLFRAIPQLIFFAFLWIHIYFSWADDFKHCVVFSQHLKMFPKKDGKYCELGKNCTATISPSKHAKLRYITHCASIPNLYKYSNLTANFHL